MQCALNLNASIEQLIYISCLFYDWSASSHQKVKMVDLRTNEERYGCNLFLCLGLKQLLGTWPNRLKTVGLHHIRPMHEEIQRCNCKEYSSQRRRKSVVENRKEPCRTSCNAIAINVMTRRL